MVVEHIPFDVEDGARTLEILEKGTQLAKAKIVLREVSSNSSNASSFSACEDWDGPHDKDNPQNWSLSKKVFNTAVPALLGFAVTVGTSTYTPSYPQIMETWHVSATVALLPLSVYSLGLALGPMLSAPISETFGRRIVYLVSVPISMLFTLGAGFSQNMSQLIVCRFFAATFGSPCIAVGPGTIADMWPPRLLAIAVSCFGITPFLGTSTGPAIGGYATIERNFRWTEWSLLLVTLPIYCLTLFTSETYKKIILQKRRKQLGFATSDADAEIGKLIKRVFLVTLARPVTMLFKEPTVILFSIYVGFAFAVTFAFLAAFPMVFSSVYHFNPGQSGLTFLGVNVGLIFGLTTIIVVDRTVYVRKHKDALKEGSPRAAPELRLYSAMMGSMGLPVSLFWFAWTSQRTIHWIVPVLAAIPFGWGVSTVTLCSMLYLMDVYGQLYSASAMAAIGIFRYILGAAFPLFTVQMYQSLGVAWATTLFAFIATAMLPIPWVFYAWGPKIRSKTTYSTNVN